MTWTAFKNGMQVASGSGTATNSGNPSFTDQFTIDPGGPSDHTDFDELRVQFQFGDANDGARVNNFISDVVTVVEPEQFAVNFELCAADFDYDEICAQFSVDLTNDKALPPSVTSDLVGDFLLVKEDNSNTVTFTASAASGTDDVITQAEVTGLDATATYEINGATVSGVTSHTVTFAGTNASETISIEVFPPEDSDVDLGTITVTATAADGNNPAITATASATADVVVDAVLDEFADVAQSSAPSASEGTSVQAVSLNLTLALTNTAAGVPNANFNAPSNEPNDTTQSDTDSSETFAVTITVGSAANTAGVDLQLSGAPAGSTLTETAAGSGIWTLTVSSPSDLTAAVAAVQAVVPANFDGTISGTIGAVSTDNVTGGADQEASTADNAFTDLADWSVTVDPSVGTPSVTSDLVGDFLLVKEDNSNTVTFTASAASGTDDVITQAEVTGLDATATYEINGATVSGVTSHTVTFAGTNASETISIEVFPPEDSDVDLGTITVTATAADGNNPAITATASATADVVVDAVLDEFADVAQSSAPSASEGTSVQAVSLNLTLALTNTAAGVPNANFNAPSNEPNDTTQSDTDSSETFAVTITVGSAANTAGVDLQLSGAPAGSTLTETAAGSGIWTLTVSSPSDLTAAVAAVQAVVPANFDGTISGTIGAVSTDNVTGGADQEASTADNAFTDLADWSVTVDPSVGTPSVTSDLVGDFLLVKEDNSNTVTFTASAASGTDDVITQAEVTGLDATATYEINGATVSGVTSHTVTFAGTNASETISIEVFPPEDSDVDLGTITVTATAADGNNPAITATASATADVVVDAVLDEFADVAQSSAPSASEGTSVQAVSLNLTLALTNTAAGVPNANFNAPSNEPNDTTQSDTDSSETFAVTITVGSAANTAGVDLQLSGAPAGSTLTETAAGSGIWTLTVSSPSDLTAAVAAVQAVVPANFDGTISGTIGAVSTDNVTGGADQEASTADNAFTDLADWSVTVDPSVGTPSVTSDLVGDFLLVKEDNSNTVTFTASAASGTDDVITQAEVTGLDATATYEINGATVSGVTSHTVTFAGTNASETISIEVFPPEDSDVDLGTITVTATAADGNNPAITATASATADVVVDAVLDEFADVAQSSAPSASEGTSVQAVSLNLTLALTNTAAGVPNANFNAPSNEPNDTTQSDTDSSETFAVTITVGSAANTAGVDLQLSGAPAGSTLTETAAGSGIWTLTVSSPSDLTAAVAAVQAVVPANFDGTISGTIGAVSTDNVTGGADQEASTADNSFTDLANWSVTVDPSVNPIVGTQSYHVSERGLDFRGSEPAGTLEIADHIGTNNSNTTEQDTQAISLTAGTGTITLVRFSTNLSGLDNDVDNVGGQDLYWVRVDDTHIEGRLNSASGPAAISLTLSLVNQTQAR